MKLTVKEINEHINVLIMQADEALHRLEIALTERTKAQRREVLETVAERILAEAEIRADESLGLTDTIETINRLRGLL